MNLDNFWKRIKEEMKAHKITQEKFAEYLSIPRSTFFRWQKLNVIPDMATAYNMATALGVSVEYLITGINGKSEQLRMEQTEARKTTEAQVKKLVEKLQEEVLKF